MNLVFISVHTKGIKIKKKTKQNKCSLNFQRTFFLASIYLENHMIGKQKRYSPRSYED